MEIDAYVEAYVEVELQKQKKIAIQKRNFDKNMKLSVNQKNSNTC